MLLSVFKTLSLFVNISAGVLQVNLTFSGKTSHDLSLCLRVNFRNHLDELGSCCLTVGPVLLLLRDCNHPDPGLHFITWEDLAAQVRLRVHAC